MPLWQQCDIALDCAFDFKERDLLNAACVRWGKPMVEAAMNSMEAYLTTIVPGQTPCLTCLYPEKPEWDRWGFGVLGGRIRYPGLPRRPGSRQADHRPGRPPAGSAPDYGPGPGRVRQNAAPTMTPTVRFVELSPGKPWPTNSLP